LTETDKGYEHAIKAIKELNEEGMGCKLIVVGDGNYRKKLEEIAFSTGGSSNIEFTGFIDRDQLDSLYGESLFFLLPSRKEGFGIVYLEAMSRGTPCIGGNYGGVPEVIDNNLDGYLVEFGNIADIKEAVKKIINDKHMYEHMQRKIEKKIATKFSYSYFEAKWLDILSERTS
jgi:glycosyltransferase involved in cell wall biosynthesis